MTSIGKFVCSIVRFREVWVLNGKGGIGFPLSLAPTRGLALPRAYKRKYCRKMTNGPISLCRKLLYLLYVNCLVSLRKISFISRQILIKSKPVSSDSKEGGRFFRKVALVMLSEFAGVNLMPDGQADQRAFFHLSSSFFPLDVPTTAKMSTPRRRIETDVMKL